MTTLTPSTQQSITLYDPCAWNPCIHGICQSSNVYDYSCTCEYGYVGRNCENVLKQCELLTPCRNGGSCTDLHGSYKCDCRLGYNGQNCEKCKITNVIYLILISTTININIIIIIIFDYIKIILYLCSGRDYV